MSKLKNPSKPIVYAPMLTIDCPCGGDEMVCAGKQTFKGFRKFFCETCHSTTWLSESAFHEADKIKKIMER